MPAVSRFERENIRRMDGYTWGEQPSDGRTIKLNTNENPWPPSPAVARALAAFDVARLRRYPPPHADGFRRIAAELAGVTMDSIIATNGGDEFLRLLLTTFLEPGTPLATTRPSYSLYPVLAAIQGSPTLEVPLGEGFELPADFASRANAAGAGITCVVNPHAPSGCLYDTSALEHLADELDGLLLIDEAYVDFVDPRLGHDTSRLVRDHDNVLILRSMSKGYALAGLRFGYGIGSPALIEPLITKTRDSYNVDLIAQELATAAIGDRAWATDNWQRVRAERERLRAALTDLGFECPPSQANFLFARVPDGAEAPELQARLRSAGVLVRHFRGVGLDDRLRITVGTPAEDDVLLAALAASLGTP
jgi:histidinol-phosphate aminotransferase